MLFAKVSIEDDCVEIIKVINRAENKSYIRRTWAEYNDEVWCTFKSVIIADIEW